MWFESARAVGREAEHVTSRGYGSEFRRPSVLLGSAVLEVHAGLLPGHASSYFPVKKWPVAARRTGDSLGTRVTGRFI